MFYIEGTLHTLRVILIIGVEKYIRRVAGEPVGADRTGERSAEVRTSGG